MSRNVSGLKKISGGLLCILLFCISCNVNAKCTTKVGTKSAGTDDHSTPLRLGKINVNLNLYNQGTILATSIVRADQNDQFAGDPVLYECDLDDQLSQYIATNGDSSIGGAFALLGGDEYYQTFFPYTALKLVHMDSGKVFKRSWQRVPWPEGKWEVDLAKGKKRIRASHFSSVQATLVKSDTVTREDATKQWNWNLKCKATGQKFPQPAPDGVATAYGCNQPNAYIVFSGPGLEKTSLVGDSAYVYPGWPTDWIGFGMHDDYTYIEYRNACVVENVDPVVMFDSITVGELNGKGYREADFNVSLKCNTTVDSGVGSNQFAMGIQPSIASYQNSKRLGLVNYDNALSHIVSDAYGSPGMAEGVGIRFVNDNYYFVGYECASGNCGARGGWRPVLEGATLTGTGAYNYYQRNFKVRLERLPNADEVTPGKVRARASVLVKMQ